MYRNLRDFITILENSGELLRIKEFVDPVLEIAELTDRQSKSDGGGKALLFENTGTSFPILTNMMGSERRICMALSVDHLSQIEQRIDSLFHQVTSPKRGLMDKLRMLPLLKEVSDWMPQRSRDRGECQKNEIENLDLLPILRSWPHDGGRFVTLPLVHTLDPDTGNLNVGMYRMQQFSPLSTGMHWHKHKTGERHYQRYKALGRRMPVTVCMGGDPAYTYAATAPLPDGIDEYILAGFLRSRAVKLVKCRTNDIYVPDDCDFVIEGYVDPSEEKVIEGPFGDHTGFYSLEDHYPTFHVTCITHRQGAIYPATLVGIPPMEDAWIALATERIFLSPIRFAMAPEIRDLWMPIWGVAHNIAVVVIEKSYAGQGFKVASALWGAGQMSFNKFLIILSADLLKSSGAPYTELIRERLHYFDPDQDTIFSKGVLDVLDHTSSVMGFGGKMCIDLTTKTIEEGSERSYRERIPISVKFDDSIGRLDETELIWIAAGNIDAMRDIQIVDGELVMDARSKLGTGFRPFPNVVTSDIATIELVDRRWAEYGIGEFIESPSRRYLHLVQSDTASI